MRKIYQRTISANHNGEVRKPGEYVVDDQEAETLVLGGYAELLDEPKPEAKADVEPVAVEVKDEPKQEPKPKKRKATRKLGDAKKAVQE